MNESYRFVSYSNTTVIILHTITRDDLELFRSIVPSGFVRINFGTRILTLRLDFFFENVYRSEVLVKLLIFAGLS